MIVKWNTLSPLILHARFFLANQTHVYVLKSALKLLSISSQTV